MSLYIDRKDIHIKLDGNALAFYANGKREGMAPIKPLTKVVIVGNIVFEASVLCKLADSGISVLFLSGRSHRYCGILHGKLHNNGILRVSQYKISLSGFPVIFSREIIKKKVSSQFLFLKELLEKRSDIRFELTHSISTIEKILSKLTGSNSIDIDSLRGYEGSAANVYFSAFTAAFPPSLNFLGREKRPPKDPVNALLSFTYTLLHFEAVREIEVIGLDPVIGFYHQFDYGRESLACDFIEPYRPLADKFVWGLFKERVFTSRDFSSDEERTGCYLKKEARKYFYELYEKWIEDIRKQLRSQAEELARRIMNGQDSLP